MPSSITARSQVHGTVFNIQRFCTHDGPGIRTTVFLKGCPLHCPWCHNPEGISRNPEIVLDRRKCIGCRACLENCTRGGHEVGADGEHLYHEEVCVRCGSCADGCYAGAIEMIGQDTSAGEVMDVVRKDKPFYDSSGGGLTLSGGEPLYQPDFAEAILQLARHEAIATAVETSCATSWKIIQRLHSLVDLWMCDVKHMDSARHRQLTGSDNHAVLDNIRRLGAAGNGLLIRFPLVPSLNDEVSALYSLGAFVASVRPSAGLEVIPFQRLGQGKYERTRRDYALGDLASAEDDEVQRAMRILREAGVEQAFCERLPGF